MKVASTGPIFLAVETVDIRASSWKGTLQVRETRPGPHAAGPQSFIGEMLRALGLANIIGPELGPFPKINPELVVRADPDLIMAGERSGSEIARRPGWTSLRGKPALPWWKSPSCW